MKLTGPVTFIYINNDLRSGPILAVLIQSLLCSRAKIRFALPAGMLFTKRNENRAGPQVNCF